MNGIDRQIVTLTFCTSPARTRRQSAILRLGGACTSLSKASLGREIAHSSADTRSSLALDEDPSVAIEFRAAISEQLRQLCSNIIAASITLPGLCRSPMRRILVGWAVTVIITIVALAAFVL